jgi:hypothetical protein
MVSAVLCFSWHQSCDCRHLRDLCHESAWCIGGGAGRSNDQTGGLLVKLKTESIHARVDH